MPEVWIFPAYCASGPIATRVDVPTATTANKLKALIGFDKTAHLFARLNRHPYDKKCPCYACERTPKGDWRKAGYMAEAPRPLFVRFDIGARNVRLNVQGGERFVVVAECDVSDWLDELIERAGRRGMMLALPLMLERRTKREATA